MMDLRGPDTVQDAIQTMTEHMACGAWQVSADERKIKVLMAALITAEVPEVTLHNLDKHELNLYKALVPHHLGKAMATGWVDWAEMAEWTVRSGQHKSKEVESRGSPAEEEAVHTVNTTDTVTPVQNTLQPNWQSIIRNRKRDRDIGYEHFQDLRRERPPVDPRQRESRYEELRKKPKVPTEHTHMQVPAQGANRCQDPQMGMVGCPVSHQGLCPGVLPIHGLVR